MSFSIESVAPQPRSFAEKVIELGRTVVDDASMRDVEGSNDSDDPTADHLNPAPHRVSASWICNATRDSPGQADPQGSRGSHHRTFGSPMS